MTKQELWYFILMNGNRALDVCDIVRDYDMQTHAVYLAHCKECLEAAKVLK